MRVSVIGTGQIGSRVLARLAAAGHDAAGHSRATGVDLATGKGLDEALAGADAVVNLTNSPTFDDAAAEFFRASVGALLGAAERAGVGHVLGLSIVGVDRVPDVAYYRAKALQEDLIARGPIPHTIVRATQFMEFIPAVMSWTTDGDTVRLPTTPLQPIAADDVAAEVADAALAAPLRGTRDIAGPEAIPLDELGRITLAERPDGRRVVTDETAGLFAAVPGDVLTAPAGARIAGTTYRGWLAAPTG